MIPGSATTALQCSSRDRSACSCHLSVGTLSFIRAENRCVEYCCKSFAMALCFVRGIGKIAMNGDLVD